MIATAREPAQPDGALLLVVSAAGTALCAITVAVTVAGNDSPHAWLEACARGLMVAAPVAVGIFAARREPFERFGRLLLLTGALAFVTTLSEASDGVAYSIGRVGGWIIEALLLQLLLAFPTGRLEGRTDRALAGTGWVIALVLYLPTALLVARYPEPTQWALCHGGCPANAFMVAGSEPAVIEDLVRPLREVLTFLVFAAVAVRLIVRLRASSLLMRRMLAPVATVAVLRTASLAGLLVLRRAAPDSPVLDLGLWMLPLAIVLLAGAFLLGLARWRLFIAAGMQRLASRLVAHPRPDDLRAALADAFDDPALGIVYHEDGGQGWVDADGQPVRPPPPGSSRALTEVRDGGRVVAGIVHDKALRDEQAFIAAATAYAIMTLDNHRLAVEAAGLLAEVQDSRARIQATADDERRRIERDLHDGAQQRLVALRIKLELAAERLDGPSAVLIRQLGLEVEAALEEVRSLARGIYPSPLADRGLVEALRSAALQAALPTIVLAAGVRQRYPQEIESAAYFACLEALQNAAKHAAGATAVVIELAENDVLRFEVRDDGEGFDLDRAAAGLGLTSMRDRLGAVDGDLAIITAPGRGTRVVGRIPLPASWCEHDRQWHVGAVGAGPRAREAPRDERRDGE